MERQDTTGRPNERQPLVLDENRWATIEAFVGQTYGPDAYFSHYGAVLSLPDLKVVCGAHIAGLANTELVSLLGQYREAYLVLEANADVSEEAARQFEESKQRGRDIREAHGPKGA